MMKTPRWSEHVVAMLILLLTIAGVRAGEPAPAKPVKPPPPPLEQPKPNPNVLPNAKKVLILTGRELHDWRKTAPWFGELVNRDPRLAATIVERPEFLASPDLMNYHAMVLNYEDVGCKPPGEEARANFRKFVESGRGLVIVHFACGAFHDWKEFANIAGRAYNPKMPAHDPFGLFTVKIVNAEHPITKGLHDFETRDELYTCLSGDAPIELLATATSRVDGKDHPMAFVLTYGKGRVFHCTLGHSVRELSVPEVTQLYRRGIAWVAGLDPVD